MPEVADVAREGGVERLNRDVHGRVARDGRHLPQSISLSPNAANAANAANTAKAGKGIELVAGPEP